MTIMPMSLPEKIYWFLIEPAISFLFPEDPGKTEIERQQYIKQMEDKGFHFSRRKVGEDYGRP